MRNNWLVNTELNTLALKTAVSLSYCPLIKHMSEINIEIKETRSSADYNDLLCLTDHDRGRLERSNAWWDRGIRWASHSSGHPVVFVFCAVGYSWKLYPFLLCKRSHRTAQYKLMESWYSLPWLLSHKDTLLNVFLAIAVDNLANAQALNRDEEEEIKTREQSRRRRMEKRQKNWDKARQIPILIRLKNRNQSKTDNPFHNMRPVYPPVDYSPR